MLIKDARSPRGRFEPDVRRTEFSMLKPVYGVMAEGESWRSDRAREVARAFLFPSKAAHASKVEIERQRRLANLDHYRQLERERQRRRRQRLAA